MASSLGSLSWLQGAGGFLDMAGMLISGQSARVHGERAKVASEFAAWQAEEEAKLSIAVSQRAAQEANRQTDIQASRALAVAAASGGGVSDPTIVKLISNVKGEGAYRAAVAMYEGDARARKLRLEAAAGRLSGAYAAEEGAATNVAYTLGAIGAGFKAGAKLYGRTLYDRYGNRNAPDTGGELPNPGFN